MEKDDNREVPEKLRTTYAMLKCAFPNGVPPGDYFPLLAVLNEHMNLRGVASVVPPVTGRDYASVYHDVLGVNATHIPEHIPDPRDILRIKQLLLPCGYEEWIKEDELG